MLFKHLERRQHRHLASELERISESFKNWTTMYRADGRKIQRAIQVDIDSIRFCTPQMIKRPK